MRAAEHDWQPTAPLSTAGTCGWLVERAPTGMRFGNVRRPSSAGCEHLALIFELLKAVLLHEFEQALDFGKVDSANRPLPVLVRFVFFAIRVRKIPLEQLSDHCEPFAVTTTSSSMRMPPNLRGKHPVRPSRPCLPEAKLSRRGHARHFVNFEAQAHGQCCA